MKLSKIISKVLIFNLIILNMSNLSYATTDIPDRYQTLEGKSITIDDSKVGELDEIEIFGNTVQDEDNLENIQSVGDLYVDDKGNPILDKQGREQYKVKIKSSTHKYEVEGLKYRWVFDNYDGGNTWIDVINKKEMLLEKTVENSDGIYFGQDDAKGKIDKLDNVYRIEFDWKFIEDRQSQNNEVYLFNSDTARYGARMSDGSTRLTGFSRHKTTDGVNSSNTWNNAFTLMDNYKYSYVESDTPIDLTNITVGYFRHGGAWSDIVIKEIRVYTKPINNGASNEDYSLNKSNNNYIENIVEVILPCQLQKVGDLSDRLYWDSEKGKYLIEKNVDTFKLEELGPYEVTTYGALKEYWSYTWNDVGLLRGYKYQSPIISNYNTTNKDKTYLNYWTNHLRLLTKPGIVKEGAVSADDMTLADYLDYANTNNIFNPDTVVMILREKLIYIDTNITSKLKVPTYDEKTHLYIDSENEISSSLKVVVDRLPQIARDAVLEAEINSSINNISLARTYVNMLPESLYKDQLHEQLNQVFSSEMVIDRKTATSNTDIYIKFKNTLSMSLDTNSVVFEDYSGTEDMEMLNAVNITINSSLPYSLNAYMPIGISNSDNSLSMNMNTLNIRESSETNYQVFTSTTDKVVLKDNCADGSSNNHSIDLKLASNLAHQADIYKTVIKFEAEQK